MPIQLNSTNAALAVNVLPGVNAAFSIKVGFSVNAVIISDAALLKLMQLLV